MAENLSSNSNRPVLVYGDGSAAVFLITQLIQQGHYVTWSAGSGAKLYPVMPYVKSEQALGAILSSQKFLNDEIFAHPIEQGIFHRVFRNKAFKLPVWKRGTNLESQKEAFEETVWKPEQLFVGTTEYRISGVSTAEIEQLLRSQLDSHPMVSRVKNDSITEIEVFEEGGKIQFADGAIVEFSQFYFCDSIAELKVLPKLNTVFKHQLGTVKMGSRVSALQVVFQHSEPLRQEMRNGLVIPMNRDSGENFDRDLMGYFLEGNRSVWTVLMQSSEIEENHEIMKKLRKLKQTLNRAFDNPEFLPGGCKEFMSTVEKEQVRFEEGYLVSEGEFRESKQNQDFVLITDSCGLTCALEKIAERFHIEPIQFSDVGLESSVQKNPVAEGEPASL